MTSQIAEVIRPAIPFDAAQICNIYNYYVINTCITFEEEPVSVEEMKYRIVDVTRDLVWLVYEENRIIKGYAYFTKWRVRSAYKYSVESTVYVDKECKGQGIGKKLYTTLIERAKLLGLHVVLGGISLPNEESVRLHEKLGFVKVAQLKEVGYKHNQWVDVGYWELVLAHQ